MVDEVDRTVQVLWKRLTTETTLKLAWKPDLLTTAAVASMPVKKWSIRLDEPFVTDWLEQNKTKAMVGYPLQWSCWRMMVDRCLTETQCCFFLSFVNHLRVSDKLTQTQYHSATWKRVATDLYSFFHLTELSCFWVSLTTLTVTAGGRKQTVC